MNEGFLSQEEINSLLNGEAEAAASEAEFSEQERDMLGEVGNISMGSASTALSKILNQSVNITTPMVDVISVEELKQSFDTPNLALNIEYVTGLGGENILVLKVDDASIIANLMMGGDGTIEEAQLTELEISAVSEAMNQMMGSAATSMATMLSREVNISPPISKVWDTEELELGESIEQYNEVVRIQFDLTVGTLIESRIMQIYPLNTAKQICELFMEVMSGGGSIEAEIANESADNTPSNSAPVNNIGMEQNMGVQPEMQIPMQSNFGMGQNVDVQNAQFSQLQANMMANLPNNIDLILDVPLEVSVVLGRTKKSVKEILALSGGSLIELDKLAEEPVEILVNGKKIAFGEVVVIDENFGVRITSIVSSEERIKTLGKN